jgi:hypothetical protein
MESVSMSASLSVFFWCALGTFIVKLVTGTRGILIDGVFFVIVIILMSITLTATLTQRCGNAPFGTVVQAVVLPWFFMLGGIIALLTFFPGWLQPFSNTFGYMVCCIPSMQSGQKLLALFSNPSKDFTKLISTDTNLLMNQFSSATFDATILKMKDEGLIDDSNPANVAELKRLIHLKDSVADFLWHILIGIVAVTTSFNIIMNTVCQKSKVKDVPVSSEPVVSG